MSIVATLKNLLSKPSGPGHTVREFKLFPFIKYLQNTQQPIKILEEAPSSDSIQHIRERLHQKNLSLGSPVKISKALEDMSYDDWLEVHQQLVQFKILHLGTKRLNHGVLLSGKNPSIPSFLQNSYVFTEVHSFLTIIFCVALYFILGLIPLPLTNEDGKLVWEALSGPIRLMAATGTGAVTSMLTGLILSFSAHQKQLKSLGSPSSTWQEVFKLQTPEDALILHMIEELDTVDIAWGDLSPQEAMDICLKLQGEDSSDMIIKLQEEWSKVRHPSHYVEDPSKTSSPAYIPVKVPKQRSSCNPSLNMNELANSFLSHSEKQRGGNIVE